MIKKIFLKRGLLLMVLLAMLAMTATPAMAASAWRPVGNPGFSSASPCGDSLYVYNGTPYALCGDADGGLTVMEYTGGKWQPVGSPDISSGAAAYESLYVYDGTPYVTYQDGNSSKAMVMEYSGPTTAISTAPAIQVNINGTPLQMDVPPMIVNGRTLVPLRSIFEALGATVQWNPADQSIVATKGNTTIKLQIGSTTALNNGAQVTLDAAPIIINGRTLVPVRFVSESLGAAVSWDSSTSTVTISLPQTGKALPGGIITTVAGNETQGYLGDGGPATSAELDSPIGVAIDNAGNLYIADSNNYRVRKVDTNGIITTIAGNGTLGYSGDAGPATNAELSQSAGLAIDNAGNLYIADVVNNRVRKVDTKGIITTVAGSGTHGYSGDGGPATSAELTSPDGLAIDNAGNLYIADAGNNCIRKVDSNGIITTVAGSGTQGYSGDEGLATSAELDAPEAEVLDVYGNLYIADTGNNCIRKVTEVATEIPSNKPDHSPETPSASTDLYSWDPILVLTLTDLTLKDHYYTVTTSTVPVNEVGSYITSIGYYGTPNHSGGVFRLYAIPKFPNYEEIAVQTKSGYLLAIEGSLVPTPGRQPWIP